MLKYETFIVNHFQENTYLVYDPDAREGVIIDPGGADPKIDSSIEKNRLKIVALLATHCHPDHIAGVIHFQKKYKAPFLIHQKEQPVLDAYEHWAPPLGFARLAPKAEGFLPSTVKVGHSKLSFIETPGHTPGGVCFHCTAQKILFSGDALFKGSIGRTDLPGGNTQQLLDSLQSRVMILEEETSVLTGHGNPTRIGIEKETNPFLFGE